MSIECTHCLRNVMDVGNVRWCRFKFHCKFYLFYKTRECCVSVAFSIKSSYVVSLCCNSIWHICSACVRINDLLFLTLVTFLRTEMASLTTSFWYLFFLHSLSVCARSVCSCSVHTIPAFQQRKIPLDFIFPSIQPFALDVQMKYKRKIARSLSEWMKRIKEFMVHGNRTFHIHAKHMQT